MRTGVGFGWAPGPAELNPSQPNALGLAPEPW